MIKADVISAQCVLLLALTQCEFCPVLVLSWGSVEWIHVW